MLIVAGDATNIGDKLEVVAACDSSLKARKVIRELEEGTYHIVRIVEFGIQVQPVEQITRRKVARGTVMAPRAKRSKAGAA